MAVNLSKNNLCINQIIEQKNEKITIESDEIVPDIKPDVLSIISSSGNICLHKKEVQDGKVRIEGTVNAYVVYIADDENSSMRAINANIDFSKNIEMKDFFLDKEYRSSWTYSEEWKIFYPKGIYE